MPQTITAQTLAPTILLTYISKPIIGNYSQRQITIVSIYKALDFYSSQLSSLSRFQYLLSIQDLAQSIGSITNNAKQIAKINIDFLLKKYSNRQDKENLVNLLQTLKSII